MNKLYIVIPTYNEEENIEEVVNEWHEVVEKFGDKESKLVVIDDGSKDNTYKKLEKLKEKQVEYLERIDNVEQQYYSDIICLRKRSRLYIPNRLRWTNITIRI